MNPAASAGVRLCIVSVALAVVSSTTTSACGQRGEPACTDIGCEDHVVFVIEDLRIEANAVARGRFCLDTHCESGPWRFDDEARFARGDPPGEIAIYHLQGSLEVSLPLPLDNDYDDSTPHTVSVELSANGRHVQLERQIRLDRYEPDPPECMGPVCYQTQVRTSARMQP